MANEWRNLARTLMENLPQATTSDEATRLVDLATIKLRAQNEALRSYRVGGAVGYVEPGPAGASPASLLEDARREIKRCSALHYLSDSAIPQDAGGHLRGVRCVCRLSRISEFGCPWIPCEHIHLPAVSAGQYGHTA
jgi:hypothetical protein